MKRLSLLAAAVALIAAPAAAATPNADSTVQRIMAGQPYRSASAALESGHPQWVDDIIAITQIPAPPFKEQARAKAFADMLRERGLDPTIDEEGNVLALRKGTQPGPVVVVSAHLDTVFPEGTDVTVKRDGNRLAAPGVGDDSAGLATLLALIDAMNAGKVQTRSDILFVGTVGEEGLGDLRGVRYLFTKGPYKGKIRAFFSLDGGGLDGMTTGATGSKRYRVTFKGPGGHSYGAFGIVNPMVALANTVAELYAIDVPSDPKTTYSASVVGGGTSVNAIPAEVWLQVDMRSASADQLAKLEKQFLTIVPNAAAEENAARSTKAGKIAAELKPIGDRPAGATAPDADIIRFAEAAYRAAGLEVEQHTSSTDSNIPMSLGIPAVTMSRIADGGRAHAPDEWIDVSKAPNVKLKKILLATILATAGVP
ncbi:MAG TPA: M20/M25/M40 family metallo-hydrolase [Sphingomicrobium sp.]|jgi:acetylornithine deacetylase/succinyl-diaminopimelate desuccinylase-like protein|nr:M20/M25/M40 family metallo-hydrolase [Sphingomicrobium sp.]